MRLLRQREERKAVSKKRKPQEEHHTDETWLIPYADLLTLLLALFIVLFASSQVDQGKFEELSKAFSGAFSGGFSMFQSTDIIPIDDELVYRESDVWNEWNSEDPSSIATSEQLELIQQETNELIALQEQLDEYIKESGLDDLLETRLNNQQLMITISDVALFASASATVKPESRALALSMAEMLKHYPQYEVKVSGHTDILPINTPEFPSNWDLSAKRALNFMKILLDDDEPNPGRFSATGYGEHRPIATNDTAEGRTQNRRVEVSIMRNYVEPVVVDVE